MWRPILILFGLSAILGTLAAFSLWDAFQADQAKKEQIPIGPSNRPIVLVMRQLHSGADAIHTQLGRSLKLQQPWKAIVPLAKSYTQAVEPLQSFTPKRGERSHWLEQCKILLDEAKTLQTACEEHQLEKAREIWDSLHHGCTDCHDAHR